ncbi:MULTISPECIES: ribosome silencing factor [Limnochorda]|uniref:ribosome silencing factor n=1 Tax=Limnochorda TaxID=1676651 RepID=UPI0026F17909|nr:ribosome silencing factor [Limnochorda pilosa]
MAAQAAEEKKAIDVLILDLREQTVLADYFVIASAETAPHVRAIVEAIEEQVSRAGKDPLRREGRQEARWILMDYGSVVVHVMDEATRDYYDLEHFWRDAPRIELAEMAQWAQASQ